MSTKKKATTSQTGSARPHTAQESLAFEAALGEFATALERLHRGDAAGAKAAFVQLEAAHRHEPQLAHRARTYVQVCERRLAPALAEPQDDDARYERAVVLSNAGQYDAAMRLLDASLAAQPNSAKHLFARASVWALRGQADQAIADLRQAIAADPKLRFQAANDPDFERIRGVPTFIDVIEPTPAGA